MNDASVAAFQHMPAEDLRRAQRSGEVGFEDSIPVCFREVECRTSLGATGAVDEDVHFAERFDRFGENVFKAAATLHIRGAAQRAAAQRLDFRHRLRHQIAASGCWDDVGSRLGETYRERVSNTAGSTN